MGNTSQGHTYFQCKDRHGILTIPSKVHTALYVVTGVSRTLYRNAKISNCIGTVHPIVPSIVVPTGTYIRGLPSVSGPVAIVRNSSETMYRNVHTIPTCEVCDDDAATTFCSNCTKNQLLCDRCHATVHRSAKKQGHKPIPAKEYLAGDGGSAAAASSRGSDIYNEPLLQYLVFNVFDLAFQTF